MLREQLRLAVHQLWGLGFERFRDVRVQLLPGVAQQAAVRSVLHQCVLEAIDRFGRRTALEHQLGGDEASECSVQLILGKARNGAQQCVGKLTPDRGTNLRYPSDRRRAVEPGHQRIVQGGRDPHQGHTAFQDALG